MNRYLSADILRDLKRKMVFVTGPRQVGKTFLAKTMQSEFKEPVYLNYDDLEHSLIIQKRRWPKDSGLVIFDEIHKMKDWKKFIKGVFDTRSRGQTFLVTGSARLETFRQSGDSLAGRYFHYRLNPFSVKELSQKYEPHEALKMLNKFGGFPEPFLSGSEDEARRWRKQYYTDLVREDILDFSRIQEIRAMRMLLELLRNRVGTPLSYMSLARDLQVSPHTIQKYIDILESLYVVFLVRPYHRNIARSIAKEPKLYFFDTGFVNADEGIKLENTVAVSLRKHVQYIEDSQGKEISLNFVRTKEGNEVDFAIVENGKVSQMIEVKLSETDVSRSLKYFRSKFSETEMIQIVQNARQKKETGGITVAPASGWLAELSA